MDLWYVNILLISLANLYLMYRRVSWEPLTNQILYSLMNLPKLASQRLQTAENFVSGMTGHMNGLMNGYTIHYQYHSNIWRPCQTFQNRHIPGVFSKTAGHGSHSTVRPPMAMILLMLRGVEARDGRTANFSSVSKFLVYIDRQLKITIYSNPPSYSRNN